MPPDTISQDKPQLNNFNSDPSPEWLSEDDSGNLNSTASEKMKPGVNFSLPSITIAASRPLAENQTQNSPPSTEAPKGASSLLKGFSGALDGALPAETGCLMSFASDNDNAGANENSQPYPALVYKNGLEQKIRLNNGIELTAAYENAANAKAKQNAVIIEIKDSKRNYFWQKQNDETWHVSPLDSSKPFKMPRYQISGKAESQADGTYLFLGEDGIRNRYFADGREDRPGDTDDLIVKIIDSKILNNEQKSRLLRDYLPRFDKRQFSNSGTKASAIKRADAIFQLSRLLEKPEAGGYSDQERAKMFEQTAFHFAYQDKYNQALNTCNVSDIGISLLYEEPAQMARLIADIGLTGKFRTADGSYIEPPKDEIQRALREQTFPVDPNGLEPSGVSRAFAIIAANIFWQRKNKGADGREVIPMGSLTYRQSPQEGLYFNAGGWLLPAYDSKGELIKEPFFAGQSILEIGEQITGRKWQNKYMWRGNTLDAPVRFGRAAGLLGTTDELATKWLSGPREINDVYDLHTLLTPNGPQIISVDTSNPPFYFDSGAGKEPRAAGTDGGRHVVVKVRYEPHYGADKKLDPNKSMIYFDNTWGSKADHLSKDRGVSLSQMYAAMKSPPGSKGGKEYDISYIQVYNPQTGSYVRINK